MTAHSAAAWLTGRPLALAPRAIDALLAARPPAGIRDAANSFLGNGASSSPRDYVVTGAGIAVVPVIGPLVARADWLTALFGAMSYGDIASAVESAAADPAVRAILLELDSPGGEVGGLFDLVDRLVALRKESGKPLWAVASENALSAAYAIASVAERLYVTRTAEVGSVGVVAVHIDESAADAMAGFIWTLIHAGARKTDGNPHEPLSASAFSDIQADVDALHAELVSLVARNRSMPPEAVRATEAAVYRGQRGVEIGFADRIGTVDQTLADLASELDAARSPASVPRRERVASPQSARSKSQMATENTTDPVGDAPAGQPQPAAEPAPVPAPAPETPESAKAPASAATPAPSAAPAAPDALRAEFAEIAAVAAQAARLGVAVDAAEAMRKGVKPDALRRSVLDALAARAEASSVVAAAPQAPVAGDSPIIRRARERATAARG